MNRLLTLLLLTLSPIWIGQPAFAAESELVETAKQSKKKRRSSSTKVITNADVKKSKGTLVERRAAAASAVPAAPKPLSLAEYEALKRRRAEAAQRVADAEAVVMKAQRDLDDVEHAYFAENDPYYRDEVITKLFAEKKATLLVAKQALAAARDALRQLEEPPA